MQSVRALGVVSCLATVCALSQPAFAESPSSEASVEARREQAKARFEAGSTHYAAGRYRQAVVEFVEADRLAPSPALSFNIARAYERLSDPSGALRWYRDYLRRSPNAENVAGVQTRTSELTTQLAARGQQQLTVLSMPPGATVVIDGRAVGVTPFTGDLGLGEHRVLLDLAGYRETKRTVSLTPSTAQDLSFDLTALPKAAESEPQDKQRGATGLRGAWPYVVGGAGVLSLGGALAFELKRRSEETDAERAKDQIAFKDHADAMQRDQTTARVLAGVGGALIVGGVVLLLVDQREPERPRVGLGCTWQGCSAVAKGRF